MLWRRIRLAPPSIVVGLVADPQAARGAAQLLEAPRVTHEVALLLRVEDALGVGEQRAVHPRRDRRAEVDLELDRHGIALAGERAVDLGVDRARRDLALEPHPQVPVRLDQLERQRPGAEDAGLPVGAERVVDRARRRRR